MIYTDWKQREHAKMAVAQKSISNTIKPQFNTTGCFVSSGDFNTGSFIVLTALALFPIDLYTKIIINITLRMGHSMSLSHVFVATGWFAKDYENWGFTW